MNRWGARIVGLLILIVFILLMLNLQNRLETMQKGRGDAATSSSR
ncbi:MAG: hypothetical protein QOE68_242 [Thermoanaerobaculia bacterium]|jgi:hypothetical protein|nr:hypothetical protein [Thermoanaerobaculia bacterium]